jgi:hypothetical protein
MARPEIPGHEIVADLIGERSSAESKRRKRAHGHERIVENSRDIAGHAPPGMGTAVAVPNSLPAARLGKLAGHLHVMLENRQAELGEIAQALVVAERMIVLEQRDRDFVRGDLLRDVAVIEVLVRTAFEIVDQHLE